MNVTFWVGFGFVFYGGYFIHPHTYHYAPSIAGNAGRVATRQIQTATSKNRQENRQGEG